jgi:dCTP deaminase
MLSDTDILKAMERGDIIISNFDPLRLGTNSYDVRLGNFFFELAWVNKEPWFIGPVEYAEGEEVAVPVGGTLLAMTKDVIGSRGKIRGKLYARSTSKRTGIAVCMCAGLGDIGYWNHWTLELSGFSRIGQPYVRVGQRIAQIEFSEAEEEPTAPYSGQYQANDWPMCMIPKEYRESNVVRRLEDIPGCMVQYS